MTPYQRRLNPYIQRMAEDMQLRNLAQSTIDSYTYPVGKFCRHFGGWHWWLAHQCSEKGSPESHRGRGRNSMRRP